MTYAGEMVFPRNAVMMTEDEMTYTEGGYSYTYSPTKIMIKLTGAETKKLINGVNDPLIIAICAITGLAWGSAGAIASIVRLGYCKLLETYNKNNSGVNFTWTTLSVMVGGGLLPQIRDNY